MTATWAFRLRQPNGTYFPVHADVTATLTTSFIRGTDSLYNVVLTARSISGDYTTAVNFFQIRDTVITLAQSANPPAVHNLRNVAASEPRTYELPPLAYADADVTETLAENYLSLWGRPFETVTFYVPMLTDTTIAKIRDTELWQRVSLFDGETTHFGFVIRKAIDYGITPEATITIMEDFAEGGDISLPLRDSFDWVFVNLAAFDMFFDRASALSNQGGWQQDVNGGSTESIAIPARLDNNTLHFVYTETNGVNRTEHENNGTAVAVAIAFDAITNRDIVVRYAAYGEFAAGDGLVLQGTHGFGNYRC